MTDKSKQAKGGEARAKKLTKEERSSIAANAAKARWAGGVDGKALPKATHNGVLKIGEAEIPCAVLEDGQRVLTQEGFLAAIGRARKAKAGQGAMVDKTPAFLAAKNLEPFISGELTESMAPILFRGVKGTRGFGYRAELLPKVCQVYLEARDDKKLALSQKHIAEKCDILIRALASVGIVALVDEATGYQEERDRYALHKLLEIYLVEERLAWAKRFPDEFYRQIYRLRGWSWPNAVGKRTPLVGKITNKIVYERLPSGVLDALQTKNPTKPGTGKRKWKHHQFLSEDIGQPDLRDHLLQLLAIMRISPSWPVFEQHLNVAFPMPGDQMKLDIE